MDGRTVAAGAGLALAVALPTVIVFRVVNAVESLCHSKVQDWFFAVLFLGWAAGGYLAGRRQPRTPFVHGLLAALASYIVVAAAQHTLTVSAGHACTNPKPPRLVGIILVNGVLAALAGMLGALVAMRRGMRS